MNSYKVYLTKSGEVARRIEKSYDGCFAGKGGDVQGIGLGKFVGDNELIPAVYQNKGYHYCIVTLKDNGTPTYELIIC
jgi:hypothetical protein